MSAWIVTLDPPAVIPGRKELPLNSGPIALQQGGLDWGQAAVQQYMSEQRYGQTPVSFRVPNRVITMKLAIGMENARTEAQREEARRQLQEKVALIQREGGVLKRQRHNSAEPLYADIVDAKLTIPDVFGEVLQGTEPGVELTLECLPDFYGEEITLDAIEEPGQVCSVLKLSGTPAVIKGDYPARTRVVLTDKSAHNQRSLLWGLRSTNYTSAAEAACYFDAYALTPLNGAVSASEAGAFSGKAAKLAAPEANIWQPFLELKTAAGKHLTHIGGYRLWARVKGTQGQQLRLTWSSDDGTQPIENNAMTLHVTGYQIVDLGEIRVEEPPIGEHFWTGNIAVETGMTSHEVIADRVWLQPVDDGAGRLRATAIPTGTLISKYEFTSYTGGRELTSNSSLKAGKAWAVSGVKQGEVTLSGTEKSQALYFAHLGLSIPTGVTIHGFEVSVLGWGNAGSGGGSWSQPQVQLVKEGPALVGSAKTSYPFGSGKHSEASHLGGNSDMWGTTLTPAQVNNNAFGVAVWIENLSGTADTFFIESISIGVFYGLSGETFTQDAVLYASKKTEVRWGGAYREDSASGAFAPVSEQTGDLVRIPPSGIERQPVELVIKNSRGLLPEPGSEETGEEDPGADKLQAQVIYRPCYIGRI